MIANRSLPAECIARSKVFCALTAAAALSAVSLSVPAVAADPAAPKKQTEAEPQRGFQLEFGGKDYVVISNFRYDGRHPITLEAYVTPFEQAPNMPRSSVVANLQVGGVGIHFRGSQFAFHVNDGRPENYGYASTVSDEVKLKQRVHVAGVFGDHKAYLIVDGKLQATADVGEYRNSPHPFMVGADPNGKGRPSQFFTGRIDEVRISKTARYTEDFEPAARLQADEDTLVLYHLDEGSGVITKDASGNRREGVIHGARWVGEDAPIEAVEKPGAARTGAN